MRPDPARRTPPLRVLMLLENSWYPRDPRVRQEASTLVAAGYEVSVICPRSNGQAWREVIDGVHVYRFPAPSGANHAVGYLFEYVGAMAAMFIISLVMMIRRGFDVVHAHNPPDTLFLIGAFYKMFGKRFVFDHHDLAPELYHARFDGRGNRWLYRVLLVLERLSCRFADHLIVANESHKQLVMTRGRVLAERITVVRNGPDLERWRPSVPPLEFEKGNKTIIAYGGLIGFQDGVDHLLKALRHLIFDLQRTEVLCLIVGDGDAVPSLQRLVTELAVDRQVLFTGWLAEDEFVRALAAADICVEPVPSNPYSDRSTMIKLMNYMALGKPIIAFDLPEHRVTAQNAAIYARPNDDLALAEALAELIDDPVRRKELGEIGRSRIERELAWCYSASNLLAAYRALGQQEEADPQHAIAFLNDNRGWTSGSPARTRHLAVGEGNDGH